MPRDILKPPAYAPDAVATENGWEDPKTGEVLVSLKSLLKMQKAASPKTPAPKTTTPKVEVIANDDTEEVEKPIAKPKAKPKSRAKAKSKATEARKYAPPMDPAEVQAEEPSVPEE